MASNGMVNLQDFLGDIKKNYAEDLKKGAEGPTGSFDGPPLPENLEYRVTVDKAEYKPSKAGKYQLVLTYEVTEPAEFAGRKVQEYYATEPGNQISQSKMSKMLGALGPDLSNVGGDWDTLTTRLTGLTGVITARTWGEANDRSGVRWVNADRGQTLRTNIAPQEAKGGPKNALRPDVSVPKPAPVTAAPAAVSEAPEPEYGDEPGEGFTEAPAPAAAPVLPGTAAPRPAGGPNLPPGLR